MGRIWLGVVLAILSLALQTEPSLAGTAEISLPASVGPPTQLSDASGRRPASLSHRETASGSPVSTLSHAELTAPDGSTSGGFGYAVSVDGSTALIGAPFENRHGQLQVGSAYVFVKSGMEWVFQAKLVAPDAEEHQTLGVSVAVDGDTAIVGASTDDTRGRDAGAAYVFTRTDNTWNFQAKLTAPDGGRFDEFGSSVSVDGDSAAVGALLDDLPAVGVDAGSAYVFVRVGSGWEPQSKLTATDGGLNRDFGASLSLEGDTLLVGSPGVSCGDPSYSGAAYIFDRSGATWNQGTELTGSRGFGFGCGVALDGDTAVIGAPQGGGRAFVFVNSGDTWTQQADITSLGAENDQFGWAVDVRGDLAVIGAPAADTPTGGEAGSVYTFRRSGSLWRQQKRLDAPDGAPADRLGLSVSFQGDAMISGAYRHDTPAGVDAGAAYIRWTTFERSPS